MKEKYEDQLKTIMFLLVIIIAILLIMLIALNISSLEKFFGSNKKVNNIQSNYNQASIITEINKSGDSLANQETNNVALEKTRLVYVAGTSILTSKIINNGETKNNFRFRVKFISYNGSTLTEITVYVGKIKAGETKYIDSYVYKDISNLKSIVYEIIE